MRDIADARDAALSRAELVEKQLRMVELTSSEMQIKYEQIMEEKERIRSDLSRISEDLEV